MNELIILPLIQMKYLQQSLVCGCIVVSKIGHLTLFCHLIKFFHSPGLTGQSNTFGLLVVVGKVLVVVVATVVVVVIVVVGTACVVVRLGSFGLFSVRLSHLT